MNIDWERQVILELACHTHDKSWRFYYLKTKDKQMLDRNTAALNQHMDEEEAIAFWLAKIIFNLSIVGEATGPDAWPDRAHIDIGEALAKGDEATVGHLVVKYGKPYLENYAKMYANGELVWRS